MCNDQKNNADMTNYKYILRKESLGICTVENLGPRGAKHEVFKIK